MTHLPWMPVYIGDELAETSHLTAEEYGAYASLKLHYWQHGRLPADDERLARVARCTVDRWELVKEALWNLFENDWRHPRLEALRIEAEETHRKRSEAGRKGGRPRREEKAGYKPGFSEEKAGPKHPQSQPQPQSHSYSHPPSNSQSPSEALDKEGDTYPRESMTSPFARPRTTEEGKRFLLERGAPPEEFEKRLEDLMKGNLTPFDIEHWSINGSDTNEADQDAA